MNPSLPIILIGPYPPVVGGVSTHISRMLPKLHRDGKTAKVIAVNEVDSGQQGVTYVRPLLLPFVLFFSKKSVIHFHVDSLSHLVLAACLRVRHTTKLTVHNNRYPTTMAESSFVTWLRWKCLGTFNQVICVNTDTQKFLSNRISNVHEKVVPAFIPPSEIDEDSISAIKKWGSQFEYILSGYAYRLSFYKGGDLYGVDLMVELISRLKLKKINAGLVLLINLEENAYLIQIKRRIKELKIVDSIKLVDINDGIDAVALWRYSDIYLRPTNTDGNSVSVMEALQVGTTVVASDCVERPEGCILFKNRDKDDFERAVLGRLMRAQEQD